MEGIRFCEVSCGEGGDVDNVWAGSFRMARSSRDKGPPSDDPRRKGQEGAKSLSHTTTSFSSLVRHSSFSSTLRDGREGAKSSKLWRRF